MIKCEDAKKNRVEFITNMMNEMIKYKQDDVHIDEIISFLEDILRHIEGELIEDYKTNKNCIGMQHLFTGHAVEDWVRLILAQENAKISMKS